MKRYPTIGNGWSPKSNSLPMVGYLFDEMSGANFNVVAESLPEDLELSFEEYLEISTEGAEEDGISFNENRTYEQNDIDWHEYIGEVDDVKRSEERRVGKERRDER